MLFGTIFRWRGLSVPATIFTRFTTPFRRWFRRLAARGLRVLAGDPGRIYSPQDGTRDLADYQVPSTTEIEDRPLLRTWVLEMLP